MDEGLPPGPPPTSPGPPPGVPGRSGSVWRQVALGTIVFAATLLVLIGLTGVFGRQPVASAVSGSAAIATATPSTAPTESASADAPSSSASAPSPVPTASATTSAPPPGDDPVLVGAGDIAECGPDSDEATAALLDEIDGTVFTAGDNAYENGQLDEFRECYEPTWGRHLDRTWPAPGNHDWGTPDLAGYRTYFGAAAGSEAGASWYARDLGSWRVIVLDSECDDVGGCGPDSPQGRWLAEELASSDARCTVAIFHVPRFSSGAVHGNDREMDPFWRALYAAGVDVIINGHEHVYERFAPQDPDAREDRVRGIREFVVGTGGRDLYEFGEIQPNSELRSALDHGVLALTLRDGSYDWQFHAATTDFSDRGTAFCH